MHVEVAGRRLYVEQRGDGVPLLCIQGMSGTHASWGEPFLDALVARGLAPVAFDHRGMGRSDRASIGFSLSDLADDAAGVLDALGLDRVHVLGISMGGMVAQELVLRHRDRVDHLVLGCTHHGGAAAVQTEARTIMRLGDAMRSGDAERAFRAGYEINLSERFRADESRYPEFRAMAASEKAPVPVIMGQLQAIFAHDTAARLPELDVPTLVVHGDEDLMVPVANGRLVATLIPDSRFEVLEGVGHLFWWEEPERSAELIAGFVLDAQ